MVNVNRQRQNMIKKSLKTGEKSDRTNKRRKTNCTDHRSNRSGGTLLIQYLRERGNVNIILAARDPQKLADSGLPVRYFDYDDPASLLPALHGVDTVFMMTGYTLAMLEQSKVFIDEARKSGVRHIVHLGACGDDNTRVAHWAWHQLIERYIEWAGFDYTHLRPGILYAESARLSGR